MINEVILEGIVVRDPWKYSEDLFFRLVVYRDRDLPAKKLDLERDAGDYVNIRVTGGAGGLIHVQRGMRLRVHGFLQSRDYRESLEEFTTKARRGANSSDLVLEIKGCELKPNQILIDRNLLEVIARRLIVLENPTQNERRARTARSEETESEEVVVDSAADSSNPSQENMRVGIRKTNGSKAKKNNQPDEF